jgi:hypothetical protein
MNDASDPPDADALAERLGPALEAFESLRSLRPTVTSAWKRYSRAAPWTLKVVEGTRTLCYLTPDDGFVAVSIILGNRAAETVFAAPDVSEHVKTLLREARPYVEGRGIRLQVRNHADVALVERLVGIKLNPG